MLTESTPNQELKIQWSSTAERFADKINTEIEKLGDNHPRVVILNKLESVIHSIFAIYENQGKDIKEVEEDLKYRLEHADNEDDKGIYKQILLFVNASFKFVI